MHFQPLARTLAITAAAIALFAPMGAAQAAPNPGTYPCSATPGSAAAGKQTPPTYFCAEDGDLVDVQLKDLHPTQPSLGYDEVYYKLGRYQYGKDAINKKFADWCEANGQADVLSATEGARLDNPASFTCKIALGSETEGSKAVMKTAVVGPGGQLYLTDGHHTFTSFWEMPDGGMNMHVRVRIEGNLSNLPTGKFWQQMQDQKWTWLRDTNDQPITPQALPEHLGHKSFANDQYRGILYFARDIGYTQDRDTVPPFQEFYWGRWMRGQSSNAALNPANYDLTDGTYVDNTGDTYLNLIENLSKAMVALNDGDVVDSGFTAYQLGKLASFGTSEWTKQKKQYAESKPGKIAYMLKYKSMM